MKVAELIYSQLTR